MPFPWAMGLVYELVVSLEFISCQQDLGVQIKARGGWGVVTLPIILANTPNILKYSTPETELYAKLSADESAATYKHYDLPTDNRQYNQLFYPPFIIASVSPGRVLLLQEFLDLSTFTRSFLYYDFILYRLPCESKEAPCRLLKLSANQA